MTTYLGSDAIVDDVQQTIIQIGSEGGEVSAGAVDRLRSQHGGPERAQMLIELALGTMQAKALGKSRPGWLFTRRMAEQATNPVIARYHADAYRGLTSVLDICTGPGVDAAALAEVAGRVVTVEADVRVAAIAAGNLRRHGMSNVEVVCGYWPDAGLASQHWDGVWADPSRRSEGRRVFDSRQYEPPLSSIPQATVVGVKTGPGDLIPETSYASEYIGIGSECRERILWSADAAERPLVTLLSEEGAHTMWTPSEASRSAQPPVVTSGAYLIEPHNAIIASGAIGAYFVEQGAGVLDPKIGYGILEQMPALSALHVPYRIEAVVPGASTRRMQQEVRRRGWGSGTVIKKRGWDRDPESVRRSLHFEDGGPDGVIFVARVGASHVTIYATSAARPGSR